MTASTAGRSASATTTAVRRSSKDCSRAVTAASAPSSSRCGATAAGSTVGASTSRSSDGRRRALTCSPMLRWASTGTPRGSASTPRSCPGTTSTPVSTRIGCGRTGRTRCARSRSTTAGGHPATTAASARPWAPRSRSGRPGGRCSRCRRSDCRLMARQPDRPPPPPVVQRLRVRYAKRDRMRFTSHRDVARALERALRRAELPMAYSAGFSPHPKVSYAGASPTGVASEAEYLEIALAERRDPDDVRRSLDAALPPGIDVVEVVEASGASLGDRIAASRWRVELREVDPADAAAAITRFLALDTAPVERLTKDGTRTVDARAAVIHLSIAEYRTSMAAITRLEGGPGAPDAGETARNVPCAILDVVVRHTTPAVRPDDVMKALRQAAALPTPVTPLVTRLAQGLLDETPSASDESPDHPVRLLDPLATDAAEAPPPQFGGGA